MNILITGGTGFIGSRLTLKCMEQGHRCIVYGQENTDAEKANKRLLAEKGAEIILGSMTERDKLFTCLEGVDRVYHLAAAQHEANIPDRVYQEVNVEGTRNILDAAVKNGVKRFIHGSTIGVFGSAQGVIDENTTCRPDNIYGVTKLAGEQLVLSYQDRLPVVVIRISETYGPGDRRLLKLFQAVKSRFFFMIGQGQNLHQLIYVDDLIDGFFLAAENDRSLGEIFLLVGKDPITTNEMVGTIAGELHAGPPKTRLPFFPFWLAAVILETVLKPLGIQPPLHRRRMDFFKKNFSFKQKKASELLGFSPKVSFQEGVRRTNEWYRERGYLKGPNAAGVRAQDRPSHATHNATARTIQLTAKTEAFDSFWEAPDNIENGYKSYGKFYSRNYLKHLTIDKHARILAISCGYGYLVKLMNDLGYTRILGIDSDPEKIQYAHDRGLNCETRYAFEFLTDNTDLYDVIFAEQEINHLTKEEIADFLTLCRKNLVEGGCLVVHSLNGANPITGTEALAQNFDHFNTLTEYSLKQILEHTGFREPRVFPLKLYIFYENPVNYIGMSIDFVLNVVFRMSFLFYGKKNRLFSKKIAARAYK